VFSGSICTAEWPAPVVVTTVDCANALVEAIAMAAESRSSFFISVLLAATCGSPDNLSRVARFQTRNECRFFPFIPRRRNAGFD
jgi:hypothetical protein